MLTKNFTVPFHVYGRIWIEADDAEDAIAQVENMTLETKADLAGITLVEDVGAPELED